MPTQAEWEAGVAPHAAALRAAGVESVVCGLGTAAAARAGADPRLLAADEIIVWGTCASLDGTPPGTLVLPEVVTAWDTCLPALLAQGVLSPRFAALAGHFRPFRAGDLLWRRPDTAAKARRLAAAAGCATAGGVLATADTFATDAAQVRAAVPEATCVDMETHALLQSLALGNYQGSVAVARMVSDQVGSASEAHFWAFLDGPFRAHGADLLVPLLCGA